MRLFFLCTPAKHRGVVDDRTGTAALHMRQHRAGHAEGAGQGHINDAQPFLVRHFGDAPGTTQARVVDQHVNAAKGLLGAADQGLYFVLEGDIAQLPIHSLQAGFGLELLDCLLQATRMNIGDHQGTAAFFGTALGSGKTDAGACGRSDQYRLASQQLVAGYIRWGLFHDEYLRRDTGCP
ncbi:hypothetical protein D3C77_525400 [compost metagenome]